MSAIEATRAPAAGAPVARSVALNTAVQVGGRVGTALLGLITVRLSTNYLGTSGFGHLATVVAVSTLLITLSDVGLSTVLPRELARRPQDKDAVGGALLRFRLLTSAAFIVATAAVVPFLPYDSAVKRGLLIALVGTFFLSVGRVPSAFFQVNLKMGFAAFLDVAYRAVALALVIVVILGDLGFYAVVASTMIASAAWAFGSFLLSRRFWSINMRFAWDQSRGLLRDSLALWAITVVGLLHFKSDMLVLAALRPAADVGIYAVAYTFLEQAIFLPGVFMAVVFPILARRLASPDGHAANVIERAFEVLLISAVPITLLLFFMPTTAIHVISSARFDSAATPLRILSFALVPIFLNSLFFAVLVSLNKQRALMVVALATVLVNTGLNLILIPRYGYDAAAATTVATETLGFVISIVFALRACRFSLRLGFVARVTIAAAVGVAAGVLTRGGPEVATAAAAVGGFLAGAVATRAVTLADVNLVLGRSRGAASPISIS